MDQNEQQGRWILQSGMLPRETVDQAWQATQASAWLDLCAVLESWGQLTPEQAQHIRHATQQPSAPSSSAPIVARPAILSPHSSSQMKAPPMSASMQSASMELMHSFESIETIGLPDYHIDSELGRGGMGVVWLGRHKETLEKVVIKAILENKKSEMGLKRFAREASILARIKHPNVVAIKDYDSVNDQLPYLVMEFVDGRDLKGYVKEMLRLQGAVPPLKWTMEIFAKLARALAACHEVGALHRDLKPANILIENETDRPVICDFGLARANTEQLKNEMSQWESLTQSGQIVGTPSFMPPEQLDSNKDYGELGAKCDVWGLGATLFYCLTGEPPYKGLSMVNLVKAHMAGEPRRLRELKPETPEWLDQLCADMLLRDSRRRPSMDELADCIENEESYHSVSGPKRLRYVGLALALVLTLVGAGLGVFIGTAPTPRFQLRASAEGQAFEDNQEDSLEIWTKDGQVTLKLAILDGQWVQSAVTRGHRYTDIIDNEASVKLEAKTNKDRIEIKVIDAFGNESATRTIIVHKDKTAPVITLDPLPPIKSDRQVVTGSLSENCRSVKIAGVSATVTGTQFRVDLPLMDLSARKLAVVAQDRAGNLGETGLPIYVVAAPDSRTPIENVLSGVKDGARLILLPGDYQAPAQITRNVEIYGVRDVIVNIEDVGLEVAGVDVSIRGCVVACRSKGKKSFIRMSRGRLNFEDCAFQIAGLTSPL
ncbi:MAG: serine/threonine-protein kinase, partial [Planctomycetota bacterium]|nr:serine/threonine-protein kinase [Planctomycetota bacterium]